MKLSFTSVDVPDYCTSNPTAVVADEDDCAQFFNCSDHNSRNGTAMECKYPDLFSRLTMHCEVFTNTSCDSRMEPQAPCEYQQNVCNGKDPTCSPCPDNHSSCVGQPDGSNPFIGREWSDDFVTCFQNRTMETKKCAVGYFHPVLRKCQDKVTQGTIPGYCKVHPKAVFESDTNCAKYYNCSDVKSRIGGNPVECNYPDLFSTKTNQCENFTLVKCENRTEPQAPCQYDQNLCHSTNSSCLPCPERLPSCIGLPDGANRFVGREWKSEYVTCYMNRTMEISQCSKGEYFHPKERKCKTSVIKVDVPDFCAANPTSIVPSEDNCAQYYNCTHPRIQQGDALECHYPDLFSRQTLLCQNFTNTSCDNRTEPQAPCEYDENQCKTTNSSCNPCSTRFSSCVGLPDGANVFLGREWKSDYTVCFKNRTMDQTKCPNGQYFHPKDRKCQTKVQTVDVPDYCTSNPTAVVADEDDCAQFFNCSDPNSRNGTAMECKYPDLFSRLTMHCEVFTNTSCDSRMEPQAPCEYQQNVCNGKDPTCSPCPDNHSSCVGQPDGSNPFIGREWSDDFVTCFQNRTMETKKCAVGYFHPVLRKCQDKVTQGTIPDYCKAHPTAVFESDTNCAKYYNCSDVKSRIGGNPVECKYPDLFSTKTNQCENFTLVKCENRTEPQAPCQYDQNLCHSTNSSCLPCPERLPSCIGLPDGANRFVGREWKSEYVTCYMNRTMEISQCSKGEYFHPKERKCKTPVIKVDVPDFCAANPTSIVPSEDNCAQYYNCTHPRIQQGDALECHYPDLFSRQTLQCQNFTNTSCDNRTEPQAPCEYDENQCKTTNSSCNPCSTRFSSCVGLPDGANVFLGREWKSDYTVCFKNRTMDQTKCPNGQYFHPKDSKCQTKVQTVDVPDYCTSNPTAVVADEDDCAQFFNCSDPDSRNGTAMECKYPDLFSRLTMHCEVFTNTSCDSRMEPQAPCEYQQNICNGKDPTCSPCPDNHSSCVGQPDGSNPFIGREWSDDFVTCFQNRTMETKKCAVGYFHPVLRKCQDKVTQGTIPDYCKVHPTAVFESDTNCAKYYNCSDVKSRIGGNPVECKYPDLFSTKTNQCENFTLVKCENRTEPQAPCQYDQNLCHSTNSSCLPCPERLPSCIGLPDGTNRFVGREWKSEFVTCYMNRTMEISQCSKGEYFHPKERKCKTSVIKVDVPDFCAANPTSIVPSEDNCAQYYNCTHPRIQQGDALECHYPDLFSRQTLQCQNFTNTSCDNRTEPQAPCEYDENRCKTTNSSCNPCSTRFSSCVGLPDGANVFLGREWKSDYTVCFKNRTMDQTKCPNGQYFHPKDSKCQTKVQTVDVPDYCTSNPTAVVADEDDCAQFFNCSDPNSRNGTAMECKYPDLFSRLTMHCEVFTNTSCDSRMEPQAPCEYQQNICNGKDPTCSPCPDNHSSCVGQPDGSNPFIGREWSDDFVTCFQNRTMETKKCAVGYFHPVLRKCQDKVTQGTIPDYCKVHPTAVFESDTNCAKYYNCSDVKSRIGGNPVECKYPDLFSTKTNQCENFTLVKCENRTEPQAPCQYDQNLCHSTNSSCLPCPERLPSCIGLPDGTNRFVGREWKSEFVTCYMNRTMEISQCSKGEYFHPKERKCKTSVIKVDVPDFCAANPTSIVPSEDNCAQYYNCTHPRIQQGDALECHYPDLFSRQTLQCQNFTNTSCDNRTEPQAPCEYIAKHCNGSDPVCRPCKEREPNCIGLPDGPNPYLERTWNPEYVICFKNRTMEVKMCTTRYFDQMTKSCQEDVDPVNILDYCKANPDEIVPATDNCAQFFNCSTRQTHLGNHRVECPYPDLFSTLTHSCQNFTTVHCNARPEPEAPCDYANNLCSPLETSCTPCPSRLPSCVGLPDGDNAYPGSYRSNRYVTCYRNRSIALYECNGGYFDNVYKQCVMTTVTPITPSTAPHSTLSLTLPAGFLPIMTWSWIQNGQTNPHETDFSKFPPGVTTIQFSTTKKNSFSRSPTMQYTKSYPISTEPTTKPPITPSESTQRHEYNSLPYSFVPLLPDGEKFPTSRTQTNTFETRTNTPNYFVTNIGNTMPTGAVPSLTDIATHDTFHSTVPDKTTTTIIHLPTSLQPNLNPIQSGTYTHFPTSTIQTPVHSHTHLPERSSPVTVQINGNSLPPSFAPIQARSTDANEATIHTTPLLSYTTFPVTSSTNGNSLPLSFKPIQVGLVESTKRDIVSTQVPVLTDKSTSGIIYTVANSLPLSFQPIQDGSNMEPKSTMASIQVQTTTVKSVDESNHTRDNMLPWSFKPLEAESTIEPKLTRISTQAQKTTDRLITHNIHTIDNSIPPSFKPIMVESVTESKPAKITSIPEPSTTTEKPVTEYIHTMINTLPPSFKPIQAGSTAIYKSTTTSSTVIPTTTRTSTPTNLYLISNSLPSSFKPIQDRSTIEPKFTRTSAQVSQTTETSSTHNIQTMDNSLPASFKPITVGSVTEPKLTKITSIPEPSTTTEKPATEYIHTIINTLPPSFKPIQAGSTAIYKSTTTSSTVIPTTTMTSIPTNPYPISNSLPLSFKPIQERSTIKPKFTRTSTQIPQTTKESSTYAIQTMDNSLPPSFKPITVGSVIEPKPTITSTQEPSTNTKKSSPEYIQTIVNTLPPSFKPIQAGSSAKPKYTTNSTTVIPTNTETSTPPNLHSITNSLPLSFKPVQIGSTPNNAQSTLLFGMSVTPSSQLISLVPSKPGVVIHSTEKPLPPSFGPIMKESSVSPATFSTYTPHVTEKSVPPSLFSLINGSINTESGTTSEPHIFPTWRPHATLQPVLPLVTERLNLFGGLCKENLGKVIPNPLNCGQFYDCRDVKGPFLYECMYPNLFSVDSLRCEEFTTVRCEDRYEPQSPCEYQQNLCPSENQTCVPCTERLPSCVALEDGSHPFPKRGTTSDYFICFLNRTVSVESCANGVYDPEKRQCLDFATKHNASLGICDGSFGSLIPNPLNCAQYYDCRDLLEPILYECEYPQLYSIQSRSCETFTTVNCGSRPEPQAPCEYQQNQCSSINNTCVPCIERLPSCVGLLDGNQSFSATLWSPEYITCYLNRTISVTHCPTGIFQPITRTCSNTIDSSNVAFYCKTHPWDRVPHPTNCAQYYDCADVYMLKGDYFYECPYPQLFDPGTKECSAFTQVTCQSRFEPQEPCEYYQNECFKDDCVPCRFRFVSCIGKPDGLHAFPGEEFTNKYVRCFRNRTIEVDECESGLVFNPTSRECGYFVTGSIQELCSLYPNLVRPHPINCAQFVDCGENNPMSLGAIRECEYPKLFHPLTLTCRHFNDVQCGYRHEPRAPCEYLQNLCNGTDKDCVPCIDRLPSCIGFPDGANPIMDHMWSSTFLTCYKERTQSIHTCVEGIFNPYTRNCLKDVVEEICSSSTYTVVPHPDNCAQFYNCEVENTKLGHYLMECPYPQLFDSNSLMCKDFQDVECGVKFQPLSRCDYHGQICIGPHCEPCFDNQPSCKGLHDGPNSYPGRLFTPDFIECLHERTIDIGTCNDGVFDPTRRICTSINDLELIEAYCTDHPDQIVPSPTNCAQYYRCATAGSSEVYLLQECMYPKLFSTEDGLCKFFVEVECGERFEPQEPCEYIQFNCSLTDTNCPPCGERLPSCSGLPDGKNGFPSGSASNEYVECFQNRTISVGKCWSDDFDEEHRQCNGFLYGAIPLGYAQAVCNEDLVSGPNGIPDTKVSASSEFGVNDPTHDYSAPRGRLNTTEVTDASGVIHIGSWTAEKNDVDQWLQFELNEPSLIRGITTQGRHGCCKQWVTKFRVLYSMDCKNWTQVGGHNVSNMIFKGNSDEDTPESNVFDCPVIAKCIRINPQDWNHHISLRAEIHGCPLPSGQIQTTAALTTGSGTTSGVITTQPQTTGAITTHPHTTGVVTTQPQTSGVVTTQPQTSGVVTTQPQTTGVVTTQPQTTGVVTTLSQTTAGVTANQSQTTGAATTQPITTAGVTYVTTSTAGPTTSTTSATTSTATKSTTSST
ncbi:hypothetical protein ACJMK2_024787, partial [Sinanodonta woodiana]